MKITSIPLALTLVAAVAVSAFRCQIAEWLVDVEPNEKDLFHVYADDNTKCVEKDWEPLVGFWKGTLAGELRLIYRVTPKCGELFVYSVDQGGAMIPATATKFDMETGKAHFDFATIGGSYKATLDASGYHLIGKWKQGGASRGLDFEKSVPTAYGVPREYGFILEKIVSGNVVDVSALSGFWSGVIDDTDSGNEKGPSQEQVILQLEEVADGLVEPKLFLPDESIWPNPIRSFVLVDGLVKIVVDGTGGNAIFEGHLEDDGTTMTGIVMYDDTAATFPLTLHWSENPPVLEGDTTVEVA